MELYVAGNQTVTELPWYYWPVFDFERDFDFRKQRVWFNANWTLCFLFSAVYLCLIFAGRKFMENRPRYELRKALIGWNVSLSLFSLIVLYRMLPEIVALYWNHGFYATICDGSFVEVNMVTSFWLWAIAWSKLVELGDTAFVVLRKQKLMFLHYYHHVSVLIYGWYTYSEWAAPIARWFGNMNSFVHFLMYAYYAGRALGYKIPRPVAMGITIAQISQMIGGIYLNWVSYQYKTSGVADDTCRISVTNSKMALLMYSSYFVLFCHYFYKAYLKKEQRKAVGNKLKDSNENLSVSKTYYGERMNDNTKRRKIYDTMLKTAKEMSMLE